MWRDMRTQIPKLSGALLALEQRLAHLRENLRTPELREEFEQANRFRGSSLRVVCAFRASCSQFLCSP